MLKCVFEGNKHCIILVRQALIKLHSQLKPYFPIMKH